MHLIPVIFSILVTLFISSTVRAAPLQAPEVLIVAIGGQRNQGSNEVFSNTVEIFSLSSNKRRPNGANSPTTLAYLGSTAVNSSTVYIVGGAYANEKSDVSSYNVATNQWQANLPQLPEIATEPSLIVINKTLYALGGQGGYGHAMQTIYSIALPITPNSAWQTNNTILPAPLLMSSFCVVALKNTIYALENGLLLVSKDLGHSWEHHTNNGPPNSVYSRCATVGDDAFIAVGDSYPLQASKAWLYSATTDTWKFLPLMHVPRAFPGVVALPGNKQVLVCGGSGPNQGDDSTNTCEVYDLEKNTWTMASFNMTEKRADFGLHVLYD